MAPRYVGVLYYFDDQKRHVMTEPQASCIPSPVNVKKIRRIRAWSLAIFLLSIIAIFVVRIFGDISVDEDARHSLYGFAIFSMIPILISGFALWVSAEMYDIKALEGGDLIKMTQMVAENPELTAFAFKIKEQGRDPVNEDRKRASQYLKCLKQEKEKAEAKQAWSSLQNEIGV